MRFVTAKEAKEYFKINPTTLKSWKDSGNQTFQDELTPTEERNLKK